jgi:hypothetical protein
MRCAEKSLKELFILSCFFVSILPDDNAQEGKTEKKGNFWKCLHMVLGSSPTGGANTIILT